MKPILVGDHTEAGSNAFVDLAELLRCCGRYTDAEDLYLLALVGADRRGAGSSPRTLKTGLRLARLFRYQSRLDRAISLPETVPY